MKPARHRWPLATLAAAAWILANSSGSLAGDIEGRVQRTQAKGSSSNFVVYIEDIHSSSPPPAKHAVMDQKNLSFVPHVLVIQVGTTVEFPNSDPVSHNVFSISEAKQFNLGLYSRSEKRQLTFDKPGVVELLCNVHLEMSGYLIVVPNPYFARTASDGTFRISDVPAGKHRLRCWHEDFPAQEREIEVPEKGSVEVNFNFPG